MAIILEDAKRNYVKVDMEGALLCDGLEKWIQQLNYMGGFLFKDKDSGKVFKIIEQ